jgi:ribosomal protein L11 methyltransferase
VPPAWLQIAATTRRPQLAEALFERWGAAAITELDAGSAPTVEMTPNSRPAFANTQVIGLFAHDTAPEPIRAALTEALGSNVAIESRILENQDWASAWLAEHPPMVFGNRLWVAPHRAEINAAEQAVVVRLDPGLAFGTGTHPTTRLCLDWLAEQAVFGRQVLDYGCGSGILAIAAAMLGADHVTAVDIDAQAVRATRANAADNGVAARIATPAIQAIGPGTFDMVLANILAKPLIDLAPALAQRAAPGAPIVLAGLLSRQVDAVVAAYRPAFAFDAPVLEQDWARLVGWRRNRVR